MTQVDASMAGGLLAGPALAPSFSQPSRSAPAAGLLGGATCAVQRADALDSNDLMTKYNHLLLLQQQQQQQQHISSADAPLYISTGRYDAALQQHAVWHDLPLSPSASSAISSNSSLADVLATDNLLHGAHPSPLDPLAYNLAAVHHHDVQQQQQQHVIATTAVPAATTSPIGSLPPPPPLLAQVMPAMKRANSPTHLVLNDTSRDIKLPVSQLNRAQHLQPSLPLQHHQLDGCPVPLLHQLHHIYPHAQDHVSGQVHQSAAGMPIFSSLPCAFDAARVTSASASASVSAAMQGAAAASMSGSTSPASMASGASPSLVSAGAASAFPSDATASLLGLPSSDYLFPQFASLSAAAPTHSYLPDLPFSAINPTWTTAMSASMAAMSGIDPLGASMLAQSNMSMLAAIGVPPLAPVVPASSSPTYMPAAGFMSSMHSLSPMPLSPLDTPPYSVFDHQAFPLSVAATGALPQLMPAMTQFRSASFSHNPSPSFLPHSRTLSLPSDSLPRFDTWPRMTSSSLSATPSPPAPAAAVPAAVPAVQDAAVAPLPDSPLDHSSTDRPSVQDAAADVALAAAASHKPAAKPNRSRPPKKSAGARAAAAEAKLSINTAASRPAKRRRQSSAKSDLAASASASVAGDKPSLDARSPITPPLTSAPTPVIAASLPSVSPLSDAPPAASVLPSILPIAIAPATDLAATCELCGETFASTPLLEIHALRNHSSSTHRPFACSSCPIAFQRKHDLVRHTRSIHAPIKQFWCRPCDRSYARADALKRHLQSLAHQQREEEATNSQEAGMANAPDAIADIYDSSDDDFVNDMDA